MIEFLCALPLAAWLFSGCAPPPPLAVGYVEGEYVLVAPIETTRVIHVDVKRGDRVEPGQRLAMLERRDAEIQVAEAEAALAKAASQLANLRLGKRPEEIAMIEASLASAKAQATEAARVEQRQERLLERGISTRANLDDASTKLEMARARVVELEASLAAARLPARHDEIEAATATVDQARAAVERAKWRLSERELSHTSQATVFDIIRNPGEVAGPAAPVLSVLPDGAVKLRLYVPEEAVADVAPGSELDVRCDGCGQGMRAQVIYVADEPEFTPPVIYSLENRQKLVYLVEARPQGEARALKPGQIVDVHLGGLQR